MKVPKVGQTLYYIATWHERFSVISMKIYGVSSGEDPIVHTSFDPNAHCQVDYASEWRFNYRTMQFYSEGKRYFQVKVYEDEEECTRALVEKIEDAIQDHENKASDLRSELEKYR